MDQSDVEYEELMKELKTEIFVNRCHQERLGEHLWRLKKRKEELQCEMNRTEAEENRASTYLEEDICSNDDHQKKLEEQLQGLEKRLRVVQATVYVEEFLQDVADEVGHAALE